MMLLAACSKTGSLADPQQRADVAPLPAAALRAAEAAPEMQQAAALDGTVSNYKMMGDLLQKAADQDNPIALVQLGDRYRRHGDATQADLARATELYRRAAVQGYAVGEVALGKAYRLGEGVVQDKAEAAYWYRQAAKQRDDAGMLLYGIALLGGEGVAPDRQQAMELITADELPDKPIGGDVPPGGTVATPDVVTKFNRIAELTRQITYGGIKLEILSVIDAGRTFTPAEIDKIAQLAAKA